MFTFPLHTPYLISCPTALCCCSHSFHLLLLLLEHRHTARRTSHPPRPKRPSRVRAGRINAERPLARVLCARMRTVSAYSIPNSNRRLSERSLSLELSSSYLYWQSTTLTTGTFPSPRDKYHVLTQAIMDRCIWAPPTPGPGSAIGNTEVRTLFLNSGRVLPLGYDGRLMGALHPLSLSASKSRGVSRCVLCSSPATDRCSDDYVLIIVESLLQLSFFHYVGV